MLLANHNTQSPILPFGGVHLVEYCLLFSCIFCMCYLPLTGMELAVLSLLCMFS